MAETFPGRRRSTVTVTMVVTAEMETDKSCKSPISIVVPLTYLLRLLLKTGAP